LKLYTTLDKKRGPDFDVLKPSWLHSLKTSDPTDKLAGFSDNVGSSQVDPRFKARLQSGHAKLLKKFPTHLDVHSYCPRRILPKPPTELNAKFAPILLLHECLFAPDNHAYDRFLDTLGQDCDDSDYQHVSGCERPWLRMDSRYFHESTLLQPTYSYSTTFQVNKISETTRAGSIMLRMSAPNHPSNLLLLCKIWEESFDAFIIAVDVLRLAPAVCEIQGLSGRSNIPDDRMLGYVYGPHPHFPHAPLAPIPALPFNHPLHIPPPSHLSLFVQFRSALLTQCFDERYNCPDEAENARWRSDLLEEEPYWDIDGDDFDYKNSPPSPVSLNLPNLIRKIEAWELDKSMEGSAAGKSGLGLDGEEDEVEDADQDNRSYVISSVLIIGNYEYESPRMQ